MLVEDLVFGEDLVLFCEVLLGEVGLELVPLLLELADEVGAMQQLEGRG